LNNPIVFVDPDGNDVDISYLSNKHKISLNKMMSTKAGKAFIGRYMSANVQLKVGNKVYSWDKSGDRAKDFLQISSMSNLRANGRNSTFKKGTYKKTNQLSISEMKNTANEGVFQTIQLDASLSSKEAIPILGHEAFVHADKDADRLTKLDEKIAIGIPQNHNINSTIVNVSSSAKEDHKALGDGEVTKFRNMLYELSKILGDIFYKNAYDDQVKDYNKR
jgi:hypothetical protein